MEESQNQMEIEKIIKNEKENDSDNLKNEDFYEDKKLGKFFELILDKNINKIIDELNHYYEVGDWKNCIIIIKKITMNSIFYSIKKEKKIELLDLIINKILYNIYFYSMQDINIIIEFFANNIKKVPKDYIIDWRKFYTLFYIANVFEGSNSKNYIYFFSKLYKFIPEDAISFEDYQIMKRTILDDLIQAKQYYGLIAFIFFLPKKYLSDDDEIQIRFLYMLKNWKTNFIPSCFIFDKILRKNGKLYFSKDPKENNEYIKQFIQYYFTFFNLYILGDSKVSNNSNISPIYYIYTHNKDKFDICIVDILFYLLFNESLKEYYDFTIANLMIILNNKHLFLKERSRDTVTINYISFLQTFIKRIVRFFQKKVHNKMLNKKIFVPRPYESNKYMYDKLLLILKYFSLNFQKLFLFDNEGSCLTQRALFSFLASAPVDNEYMKQVLININFEQYLKMWVFLKAYSETRMVKCITKLYSLMPLLLNEYVFSNYPNVRELIKESIKFFSENVSSANSNVDLDILITFCYEFFRIKELSKKNKIYEFLIPIITEATIKVMNNLLRILDLICKKNNLEFNIFVHSMKKFLDKESLKKISSLYTNFIEDNEIQSSNMENYLYILNDEELVGLFNYIHANLLYIDNSNNVEINKHFLYNKFDKDFNIDISHCSIEIFNEKQLQGYLAIFSYMNFTKIFTDDKMLKKFYELYYALVNQKEKKFKKLGNEFFGIVINSFLECSVDENYKDDDNTIPLIKYPTEKQINISIQMYEKIILPYEKFVVEYMEKSIINNNKKNQNKDIDKQTLEQILGIYMKLIHKVSIAKCNLILNINFDEEFPEEYKIIEKEINQYKKYKMLLNNSLKVIKKIFDYNIKDIENKLFDNHLTSLYLDEILALKLKTNSQTISNRKLWFKSINKILYATNFINNLKDIFKINSSHLVYIRNFKLIKLLIPKDDFYYTFLDLYLLSFNSVNHPSSFITTCTFDFYSINREKIKSLFNEIFDVFIKKLANLKTDSLTEQNIMKNISETYNEFCVFFISLFPYNSLEVIEKLFKIIKILKDKKYRRIDNFISVILSQIKVIINLSKYVGLKKDKRFLRFSKKNEIIEEEMNKIYQMASQNSQKEKYLVQHSNNIKKYIEKSLNLIFPSDGESINTNDKSQSLDININQVEKILVFVSLTDYIKVCIDKKDELYRKVIQIIFNNVIFQKFPLAMRILWIQKLYVLMNEENLYYQEYEWIKFKSKEEYLQLWNKLKYEKSGKESMIPYPVERIRINSFKFDEYLNNNLKYDFDIEKFLYSMAEIDEFEEDQKLVKKAIKKLSSLDEVVSKLVNNKFNEKKGLDFSKAKMFYYMLKLKYIDYNLDFVKNLNFNTKFSTESGKKIKQNCVIYEFLLGKYEYMCENKLFKEKDRDDLWSIMNRFTRRADKIVDERIYAFFNYIFNNYALGDLEFIFNYDFYKYPIDFVADMYFLYHQDLPNLRNETKMFINSKTEELLTKIFSTDENIILDLNYLVYVLKIYYTTNGILKYNHYIFKSEYNDKLYEHFLSLLEKSDTKHRRYGLFTIYIFFFEYLNNNLPLLKATLQKMGLCINEFHSSDKMALSDKGKKILPNIETAFRGFTGNIHFPSLCDAIVDILNKENDRNDTNKIVYLQVVNLIYKGQKHLNLFKYSSQEIFDSLFKVFESLKNEELKKNFSNVFLSYFNDLSEEENIKFIQKYEKYIFENTNEINEDKNKYNYIYILMNQLLRFKINLPEYMQKFIIKLKVINRNENDKLKKIVIDSLKNAMKYYRGSYIYMKENISQECKEVLEEMTREKTYFI